jgi:hypothetical protein
MRRTGPLLHRWIIVADKAHKRWHMWAHKGRRETGVTTAVSDQSGWKRCGRGAGGLGAHGHHHDGEELAGGPV